MLKSVEFAWTPGTIPGTVAQRLTITEPTGGIPPIVVDLVPGQARHTQPLPVGVAFDVTLEALGSGLVPLASTGIPGGIFIPAPEGLGPRDLTVSVA